MRAINRQSLQPVQREIEFQHVDTALADDAEEALPDMFIDQRLDAGGFKMASAGDARGLELRGRRTQVRIETARRSGNGRLAARVQ